MITIYLFRNLLLLAALLHFLRRLCFWAYLWQLKEYRWARMKEELERNHKIIPWEMIAGAAFIFALAFGAPYFFILLAPTYFFLGGLYSIFKASQGKWALPKFTKKIILILFLAVTSWGSLLLLPSYFSWLQAILLVDILLPVLETLVIGLVEIPASLVKKHIIRQAKKKREKQKNLIVIGITGSYGKTSVKKFLSILLKHQFGQNRVLITPSHVNTKLGIAQTILDKLKPSHHFFVCEMGAYHQGEIRQDSQLVQPKIGILTGINEQHLALFGSLEKIKQTKAELVQSLPATGVAIFNGDDQYVKKIYQSFQKSKRLATTQPSHHSADLWAEDIKISKKQLEFKISDGKISLPLRLPLTGRENIINILLASLAAQELGLSLTDIQKYLQNNDFQDFQKIYHQHGLDIIDATYSTNPNAFLIDLTHLKLWSGKKIVITPGLIELGSAASRIHQELGEKLAEIADLVILTKNYYLEDLQKGIQKGNLRKEKKTQFFYLSRPQEVIQKVKQFAKSGDVVLLEGRLPQIIKKSL